MLFECFYEMGERMCLGRDDSIKDQQTFKCFFVLPVRSQNRGLRKRYLERSFPAGHGRYYFVPLLSHVSARDRFFIDDPALMCDVVVYHERIVREFPECLRSFDNNIDRHTDPIQISIEFHCEFPTVFNPPLDDADIIVALMRLRPF